TLFLFSLQLLVHTPCNSQQLGVDQVLKDHLQKEIYQDCRFVDSSLSSSRYKSLSAETFQLRDCKRVAATGMIFYVVTVSTPDLIAFSKRTNGQYIFCEPIVDLATPCSLKAGNIYKVSGFNESVLFDIYYYHCGENASKFKALLTQTNIWGKKEVNAICSYFSQSLNASPDEFYPIKCNYKIAYYPSTLRQLCNSILLLPFVVGI
ncbi:MAG: hypothetical protein RL660_2512, partial [Bacteroidota bacterium]